MDDKQNKVFSHPEKEEIIKKLLNGESVKSVESWLKEKHPRKKRLQISYMTLQKFRKDYLNLEGDYLADIQAARKEASDNSIDLEAKAIIASSSAYQKKIEEIASNQIDSDRKMIELMTVISARIEYYFNAVSNNEKKTGIKEDKMFLELINTQRGFIQDYKKYVEKFADQRIDHNINVTIVNEQITVLKNIVLEVLQHLDPELIPLFIEKINSRLLDTQHGTKNYENYQQNDYRKLEVYDAERD